MILTGTDHRPNKLGGHSAEVCARLKSLAIAVLKKEAPSSVISGMALGWDTALAQASVAMDIPFIAAIPFAGQEGMWPKDSQQVFNDLLAKACRVHIVCSGEYHPVKCNCAMNGWLIRAIWSTLCGMEALAAPETVCGMRKRSRSQSLMYGLRG